MEAVLRARQAASTDSTLSTSVSSTITTQPSTSSPSTTVQTLPTTRDTLPAFPSQEQTSSASTASPTSNTSIPDAGPVSYYFVFFALILCVIAFAGFLFWRRKRAIMNRAAHRRTDNWTRSGVVASSGSQPWLGRWRSAEASREEGLNEQGEAPPPYVSKAFEEPGLRGESGPQAGSSEQSAIPLQNLERTSTGAHPPDYAEVHTESLPSRTEPSSSRLT